VRSPDDDDVADDQRRRVQAQLARVEIHILIVFELQIDGAVASEGRNRNSGPCIERQHSVARCDVDDAPFGAVGAGPIGESTSSAEAGRILTAHTLILGVHPEHLSGCGVECHGRAPCARRRVQHSVDQ
jgi:hypothetical protein